jgi:hypothetical protein
MSLKTVSRPLAWLLVAGLVFRPEWVALAQTPQPPAPPVAPQPPADSILDVIEASDPVNMPSATSLTQVPDSLPLPGDTIVPTRTMIVSIEDALEGAGIDTGEASASRTADGGVTVTVVREDGDVIVTGHAVDGRIVLDKKFQPLLSSGQLGEAVDIKHKPGAAPPQTAHTPAANPPQPTEAEVQAALDATLKQGYGQLLDRAKQVQGPRSIQITETGGFFSSKGETFIPFTDYTIAGLLGTRDLYVRQLMTFLNVMSNLRLLSPEARLERIKRLMALAHQAKVFSEISNLAGQMGTFDDAIKIAEKEAAAAEQRGDTAFATTLREILGKPLAERAALAGQRFLQVMDQDSLLAVGDFWETLADGGDPKEYVDEFNATVAQAIQQTHTEINRVGDFTTVAELAEFLKPQYARTRQLGGMLGGPYTKMFELLDQFASAYVEVKDAQGQIKGLKVALFTVVVGGIGLVVAAPFVVAGAAAVAKGIVAGSGLIASGIQLGYDGYVLYGANTELTNARNASGVVGYYVLNHLEQQRRQAAFSVALDTAFVAFSAFQLRAALAEIRAARAGQIADSAAGTAATGTKNPIGPYAPMGSTPNVQRGVQRARELGIPESEIDDALALANQEITPELPELIKRAIHAERSTGAQLLTQVGQLDDMTAAARAAGVTQAEIDAMYAAARQTGGMAGFGRQLPTDLLRATLNKQGSILIVDSVGPALRRFTDFWRNVLPANWFRTDMVALTDVISNLRWMQAGRVVRWTNDQIAILQRIVARPDASRMYAYISDENVYVKLFSDDLLAAGNQFLKAPNRNAIAAGLETLPTTPVTAAPGAASTAGPLLAPLGASLLTGEDAWRALQRWAERVEERERQQTSGAETQVGSLRIRGDFNGDGLKEDFAFLPGGPTPRLNVTWRTRAGMITGEGAPGTVTTGTAADVNGDGIDDLILGGPGPNGTGGVHVALGGPFLHPGASFRVTLPQTPNIALPSPPTAIASGDLDGDKRGEISIAIPNPGKTTGSVWTYNIDTSRPGKLTFGRRNFIDLAVVPSGLAIGPSSGAPGAQPDGDPDLFISTPSGITIIENNSQPGSIDFNPNPFTLQGPPSNRIVVGDVDHDAVPDFLTFDPQSGRLVTYVGNPGGGYRTPLLETVGPFSPLPEPVNVFAETPLVNTWGTPAPAPPAPAATQAPADDHEKDYGRFLASSGPYEFEPYELDREFGARETKTPPSDRPGINSYTPRFPGFRFGTSYAPSAGDAVIDEALAPLAAAPGDVESQYELLMRLLMRLGFKVSSRPDFGGLFARLRDALLIRPETRGLAARSESSALRQWRAGDEKFRQRDGGGAARGPSGVMLATSLGVSTGEAFRVHAATDAAEMQLVAEAIVVQPLKGVKPEAVAKATKAIESRGGATATADGYCLEFLKEPPKAGMAYRIAPPDVQRRFEPLRRVAKAASKLQELGLLKPDSDPKTYFHSITQWAMWAKEQKFDRDGFRRALVDYTKKNVLRGGRQWVKEMEQVVEKVVPHRWEQIQHILAEAAK